MYTPMEATDDGLVDANDATRIPFAKVVMFVVLGATGA
jgi:hypothetical protein